MNHGVVVVIGVLPPVSNQLYNYAYSSVAISGLLDIDTNPMIPALRLIQFLEESGHPRVGFVSDDGTSVGSVGAFRTTYELAQAAWSAAEPLDAFASRQAGVPSIPYPALVGERRVLAPLHHSGSRPLPGVGHGPHAPGQRSGARRHAPEAAAGTQEGTLTDSMRMFQWGVEGGKPAPGHGRRSAGVVLQGRLAALLRTLVAVLDSPSFALDGGEEPELVGLYVIGPDGTPYRLGFALGNEFSDHVTERSNYLYLAHSKLRACAVGPELRTGALPRDLRGHQPHPARWRGGLGKALSYRRGQHVPLRWRISSTTISSTPRIAVPETCTCISSAPRR